MPEPRVFIEPDAIRGAAIHLAGDAFEHVAVVLRRGVGDRFIAVDAHCGTEHTAQITEVGRGALQATVLQTAEAREQPTIHLCLYQGLPKGKRFPLIIQKCTELGVARIVPVLTERAVARVEPDEAGGKLTRWTKIAQEAARQSLRPIPPVVDAPLDLRAALADWRTAGGVGLLLDEALAGSDDGGLRAGLAGIPPEGRVSVFIGPEGGFSTEEAETARDAGLLAVGLGSRILRTETAAIAVCAIVMYEAGQLG